AHHPTAPSCLPRSAPHPDPHSFPTRRSSDLSTGDGILTSLKMMEVMLARKKKMSQLSQDLRIYPQVLVNVRVKDKAAAQADPDVDRKSTRLTPVTFRSRMPSSA